MAESSSRVMLPTRIHLREDKDSTPAFRTLITSVGSLPLCCKVRLLPCWILTSRSVGRLLHTCSVWQRNCSRPHGRDRYGVDVKCCSWIYAIPTRRLHW